MKTRDCSRTRFMNNLGAFSVAAWLLLPGTLGIALLGGVAYAMVAGQLALGLVCGCLLCVPLGATVVWGSLMWIDAFRREAGKGDKSALLKWYRPEGVRRTV
jgi:hypothetical protein